MCLIDQTRTKKLAFLNEKIIVGASFVNSELYLVLADWIASVVAKLAPLLLSQLSSDKNYSMDVKASFNSRMN